MAKIICDQCGTGYDAEFKFCPGCGAKAPTIELDKPKVRKAESKKPLTIAIVAIVVACLSLLYSCIMIPDEDTSNSCSVSAQDVREMQQEIESLEERVSVLESQCGIETDQVTEISDSEDEASSSETGTVVAASDSWAGDADYDFSIRTDDGDTFTLSDMTGKVVVINFWASYCDPCAEEMPDINTLYSEYDSSDVCFLCINSGETSQVAHSFVSRNGYDFPVAYDTDSSVSSQYGVDAIPMTFIFARDGSLSSYIDGMSDYDELKAAIEAAK